MSTLRADRTFVSRGSRCARYGRGVKRAVFVAGMCVASAVSAAPRTAQLSFAGDTCSEEALVSRVHDLVGRDPFAADAPLQIDVHVDAGPRATVSIAGRGQRELGATTCGELMDALALVIAIDLSGDQPTTPVIEPTTPVIESRPDPSPAAEAVRPESEHRPTSRVRMESSLSRVTAAASAQEAPQIVSLVGGLAASTRGTPSGSFGARLGRGWWSIEGVVGTGAPEKHAMIDVVRGGVAVAACVHVGPASACPMASAGWVVGRGHDLVRAETATTPAADAGMRLAVERDLTRGFGLRARIDGTVSLTSTTFTVDDSMVWESPRGELVFGIDMLAQIP